MAGPVGTMPRRQLGRRLRALRERAGLTIDVVAKQLETSSSRVCRIEHGQQRLDVHLLRAMLDLYGVPVDEWEPYLDLRRRATARGWWRDFGLDDQGYVGLEAAACQIRDFQPALMPGLLQTAEYARALFAALEIPSPEEDRERQVQIRMIRQRRLFTDDDPLELVAIVDEAVLHRRVGGPAAHREQLEQLIIFSELDTVTIQVVPFELGARPAMDGGFTLLGFADPDQPELAFVEYMTGTRFVEKIHAVNRCKVAFEQLRSIALGPAESIGLVERLIAQI